MTTRQQLQKPLPPESIKPHPTKSYLSTIKAIYVTERFNEVFGIDGWSIRTDVLHWFEKVTPKGKTEYTVMAKTSFTAGNIYHECIAGSTNEDLGDAAKGATTDAITKIGSYLEVGIDVFKGLSTPDAKTPTPRTETKPTPAKKEWLNPETQQWATALVRIKGGMKIEDIKKFFLISKANEERLINESK